MRDKATGRGRKAATRTIAMLAVLHAPLLTLTTPAHAAESANSTGSATTIINGKPAERAGDRVGADGMPAETSSNVFIDGKPAAIGGTCPDGTSSASPNVFINGKPASIGCRK